MANNLLVAVCGPNRFNVATDVVRKWESVQKLNFEKACCFFANKWDFEQMGICTQKHLKKRAEFFANKWEFEQMGI